MIIVHRRRYRYHHGDKETADLMIAQLKSSKIGKQTRTETSCSEMIFNTSDDKSCISKRTMIIISIIATILVVGIIIAVFVTIFVGGSERQSS